MAKRKPIKLITLDTETYRGLTGKLKRIAIYDGEKVIYDYTFSGIEKHLREYAKKFNVHIYIHNIEFDLRKLDGILNKIIWEKSFIISGKLATVKTKYYTLHDSMKIVPAKLSDLSKDFEVKHGKLNLLDEIPEKYLVKDDKGEIKESDSIVNFLDLCDVDDEIFLKYLGYDVISLYEVLEKIMTIADIGLDIFVKRVSTASLSRYIFKNGYKGKIFKEAENKYTDYEILCQYNWKNKLQLEKDILRQSYCGGRTEVFKPILHENGYHYDINSMYPYVMLREYPIGAPDYYNNKAIATEIFNNWLDNHKGLGFIQALVYVPKQNIPPLPAKKGKLIFPTGEFFGTWTFHELEYAIKNCGVEIREIHTVTLFKRTAKLFKNFIETFYKIKEEASREGTKNKSLRTFAKLLMNVGYGYTGMSRDDKVKLDSIKNIGKYKPTDIKTTNEQLGYIEVKQEIEAEYIQVQVASYVTSYARLELLKVLKYCDERGNVFYCDTDSVVTDVELPQDWVHKTKLGGWDCEAEPIKAIFLRPKVYAEITKDELNIKFKGISRDTQKSMNYYDYENICQKLIEGKEKYHIVEKDKILLRSILFMTKNNLPTDYYETRDKKMNLKTIEKRQMNYKDNYTEALHFNTYNDFNEFKFKIVKDVNYTDEQTNTTRTGGSRIYL